MYCLRVEAEEADRGGLSTKPFYPSLTKKFDYIKKSDKKNRAITLIKDGYKISVI